ncbi:hypothetical protein LINPERPRIM_LOCUS28864 [Linum perenne]
MYCKISLSFPYGYDDRPGTITRAERVDKAMGFANPAKSEGDALASGTRCFSHLRGMAVESTHPNSPTCENASTAASICGIWREQNCRVLGEEEKPAHITDHMALDEAKDGSFYNPTTTQTTVSAQPSCLKWHPLEPGGLTCNVDGALFRESMQYGAEMLIRRDDGSVVKFRTTVG